MVISSHNIQASKKWKMPFILHMCVRTFTCYHNFQPHAVFQLANEKGRTPGITLFARWAGGGKIFSEIQTLQFVKKAQLLYCLRINVKAIS